MVNRLHSTRSGRYTFTLYKLKCMMRDYVRTRIDMCCSTKLITHIVYKHLYVTARINKYIWVSYMSTIYELSLDMQLLQGEYPSYGMFNKVKKMSSTWEFQISITNNLFLLFFHKCCFVVVLPMEYFLVCWITVVSNHHDYYHSLYTWLRFVFI